MGLLNFFSTPSPVMSRLPAGCFTMDRAGKVLTSTLPQSFPTTLTRDIGDQVLATFREAQSINMPLNELIIHFASLKITAREMCGGAIVFLTPQTFVHTQN